LIFKKQNNELSMALYFITGTDTSSGKTYVTQQLQAKLPHTLAIKPIASGCVWLDGSLVSEDARQLHHPSSPLTLADLNPWRFEMPVSPHIAAAQAGVRIEIDELAHYCLQLQPPGIDTLLIEGAGGLMVPLNEKESWIDFLKVTKIPVILVVGLRLGCLNHALLTQEVMEKHQLPCCGWIANCLDAEMLALEENIATLSSWLKMPLLGRVNFGGELMLLQPLQ
jgi:dethiobiotin synthetase